MAKFIGHLSSYGGPWVPTEQAKALRRQTVNLALNRTEMLAKKRINGACS